MSLAVEEFVAVRTGEREALERLQCGSEAWTNVVLAVLTCPLVKTDERVVVGTLAAVLAVVQSTVASVGSAEYHTRSCSRCICEDVVNLLSTRFQVAHVATNLHADVEP